MFLLLYLKNVGVGDQGSELAILENHGFAKEDMDITFNLTA
jgi:hypothetical protein